MSIPLTRGRALTSGLSIGLPAIVFLLLLFVIPVGRLLLQGVDSGFGPLHRALGDSLYLRILADTLVISFYVTVVCLILGYPLAYALTIMRPGPAAICFAMLLVPFWTSILVRTYAWMVLLGRNGIINNLLMYVGIIDTPMAMLNNLSGVLIGMVHVLLPYMVFPLYGAMKRIDPALVPAAEGLGASGLSVFLRVYFPLTLPGVLTGVTLVFVVAMGFYITPALLGGGRVGMMAVVIERQVREFLDWPMAAALSIALLGTALLITVALRRLMRGDTQWT
jgi:ABC-type spermidine/putrescine transport system permease subunit I